jgi:hypothetical protein
MLYDGTNAAAPKHTNWDGGHDMHQHHKPSPVIEEIFNNYATLMLIGHK